MFTLVAHAYAVLMAGYIFFKLWPQPIGTWKIVAKVKARETMTWAVVHLVWNLLVGVDLLIEPAYTPVNALVWPAVILYFTLRLYLNYKATWWAANGEVAA